MTLNQTGKRNLIISITLAIISVGILFYTVFEWTKTGIFPFLHPAIPIGIFCLPAFFYGILVAQYRGKLEILVFTKLGFQQISGDQADEIFNNFLIQKLGKFSVQQVLQGRYQNADLNFVKFSLTVGSGKYKRTYHYLGLTFTTEKPNYSVQMFDQYTALRPFLKRSVKLDSNEFDKMFDIYASDEQNAYYQLDPDTMADLIDIRARLKYEINLETLDNRVLVFTGAGSYNLLGKIKTTFAEVINCEVHELNVEIAQDSVTIFISEMQNVFQTLDLTAK